MTTGFVFTEEQLLCINEVDSVHHGLIPATAGSGKSTVVPRIIEKILSLPENQHLCEDNILVVTFCVLAAASLEKKLKKIPWLCSTFHSVAAKILLAYKIFTLEELYLLNKNEYLIELLKFLRSDREESIHHRALIAYGLVDEFQDGDQIMYDILLTYKDSGTKISVVGHDFQAIYAWRFSKLEFIQNFERDFTPCRVYPLSVNFRCSPAIVRLSNQLMSHGNINAYRTIPPAISKEEWICKRKNIEFKIDPTTLPRLFHTWNLDTAIQQMCLDILSRKQKDRLFRFSDVFILTRNNKTIQQIRTKMISLDLPCYNVKDSMKRKKKGDVVDIRDYYVREKIGLLTAHAAKGLEKKHVYITFLEEGTFPDYRVNVEEERRLLYVAITRAQQTLTLWNSSSRPSLFIQEFYQSGLYRHYFQTVTHQIILNNNNIKYISPSYPAASTEEKSAVCGRHRNDDDDDDDDTMDEEEEKKNEVWEKMISCSKLEEQCSTIHAWIAEHARDDTYTFDKKRFSSKFITVRKIDNKGGGGAVNDLIDSKFVYENDLEHIMADTFECFLHRYFSIYHSSEETSHDKVVFPFAEKYTLKSLEKKLPNIPLAVLDKILIQHYKHNYQNPFVPMKDSLIDCYWTSVFLSLLNGDIFHIHLDMKLEYLQPYLKIYQHKIQYLQTCFPSLSSWTYYPSTSTKTHLPSYLVSSDQRSILFLCGRTEEDIQINDPFQLIVYFVSVVCCWNLKSFQQQKEKNNMNNLCIIYWYLLDSAQLMQLTLVSEDWYQKEFVYKFLKSLM